ncbi:MAG: hypothetical protein NC102_06390 [Clostridium sp.]|nr:hypothetical protein [Clostridium sp.]
MGISSPAIAAAPQWEAVQLASAGAPAFDKDKVEVTVRDGYIYVYAPKAVEVRVMSIVGQLISQKNLPAGISRLRMSARGIYILKAGDVTLRVTV